MTRGHDASVERKGESILRTQMQKQYLTTLQNITYSKMVGWYMAKTLKTNDKDKKIVLRKHIQLIYFNNSKNLFLPF